MMSRNSKLLNRIWIVVIIVLSLLAAASTIKLILCDYVIDESYHVTMSYRHAMGDRLLMEMWEPHQTSAFLCAFLIRLYMVFFHTTTGIVIVLRVCGIIFHLAVSIILFRTTRLFLDNKSSVIIAFLFYSIFPKLTSIPEFSNMMVWFLTLSFCFMCYAETNQWRKPLYTLLSSTCFFLALLSYPALVILVIPMLVFFLIQKERRSFKALGLFAITSLAEGCLYFAYVVWGKDLNLIVQNALNVISGDESHGGKNAYGISQSAFVLGELGNILIRSLIILLIAMIIGIVVSKVLKKKDGFYITCLIVIMLSGLLTAYYCFVKNTGYTCLKVQYILFPIIAVIGLIIYRKKISSERLKFFIPIIVTEMTVIVSVTMISNVALSQNLVFTQVGLIVSVIVILYLFTDHKQRSFIIASMIFMCVLSYGITGYTQMMSSTGTNIFQYNAIVKDGPAYNSVCDYVVKEWYETGNAEFRSIVNDDDSVFIISDNMEVSASELYMLKPVKISQYSTICTPTYEHKHVEYWEQFPDRFPNVLIIESSMMSNIDENYIYSYLMDNYRYEKVLDGAHYTFYRKN